MGQKLMGEVAALTAPDAKTIKMVLKEPYGLVIDSLGKSASNVPFMMPKRIADTDPNTQITDATGSGPFIFKKDEWKPGEKAVYVRNPKYKPRNEPASGLAGGKVAKVDRVEWITIPDQQTQVNALMNGEIDMIEIVPPDLLPLLAKDKSIKVFVTNLAGRHTPCASTCCTSRSTTPRSARPCSTRSTRSRSSTPMSATRNTTRSASRSSPAARRSNRPRAGKTSSTGNAAKAKQLLQEAGYDGTPIVLMHQTDTPATTTSPPWPSRSSRQPASRSTCRRWTGRRWFAPHQEGSADEGGWSAFFTSWGSTDVINPVSAAFLNASCDKATFGWPCDEALEKLRDAFAKETDPAKQKAIAEQSSCASIDYPTHVILGQFTTPTALRTNVNGLLHTPALALWNVEKK